MFFAVFEEWEIIYYCEILQALKINKSLCRKAFKRIARLPDLFTKLTTQYLRNCNKSQKATKQASEFIFY